MIKTIIIVVSILFVVLFGSIIFIFFGIPYGIERELKAKNCEGLIIGIRELSPCFWEIQVKQTKDTVHLTVQDCCGTDKDFFKFTKAGDSIKKEHGQLFLIVSDPKTNETKKFDYPYCIQ